MNRPTLLANVVACGLGLGAIAVGMKLAYDWTDPLNRVSSSQDAYYKAQTEQIRLENERLKSAPAPTVVAAPTPAVSQPKPEPVREPVPPAPQVVAIAPVVQGPHSYAPSCSDIGPLVQAVNRTPRATPYEGTLLVSRQYLTKTILPRARGVTPCVAPGTYQHLTLGKFSVSRR